MATASGHFNVARGGSSPYASAVALVDTAYMGFYQQVRTSARRISRVLLALLPLMMLLVGSCKTSQVTDSFSTGTNTAQFRAALFPDRVADDKSYRPAGGYVNRARDYIEGDPAALMRLTEAEVSYLFGKPTMERKDADARIWQYKTKSCVVDFFFYDASGKTADGKGKPESPVSYVDYRLKEDLQQGSAARLGSVPESSQSKCIEKIVSGDGFSFTG
ncbi:MAG: hypothetical protein PW788_04290 [Micavibrio sp.]|nr:hypothetical protein [Micavibrio sp.]